MKDNPILSPGGLNDGDQDTPTAKGKEVAYRCVEKCTYAGKFWKVGETLVLPEKTEVPHFKPVG